MVQGNTLITVNHSVWMDLPEHVRNMWERLGEIEPVKGTSPRLLETVTPDVQKAIQDAKGEIPFLRKWNRSTSTRGRSDYCYGFVTDLRDQLAIGFRNR